MVQPVHGITVGGDPEGFVAQDGQVIGSEKLIPPEGLHLPRSRAYVVRDGVQFELNPPATNTVREFGAYVSRSFNLLGAQLKKYPSMSLDWRGLIEVMQAELDSLSPDTRILGCNPSLNIYGTKPITVDVKTYRKRSAGGHLHFGLSGRLKAFRTELVPLFDIMVGLPSVLLDRDPGAQERRENYGRAGEYRIPKHGIEYRTPSNYWLRNYSLLSFVHGMANFAISVVNDRIVNKGSTVEDDLLSVVNIDHVIEAIDTNNFNLARMAFDEIRPFLAKHLPEEGFPLAPNTIDKFLVFADGVQANGLEQFFPDDPLTHWTKGEQVEFSQFLKTIY